MIWIFVGLLDSQDGSEVSKDQWITSDPDLSLSGFSFLNNLDTDIKDLGNESRLSDMVSFYTSLWKFKSNITLVVDGNGIILAQSLLVNKKLLNSSNSPINSLLYYTLNHCFILSQQYEWDIVPYSLESNIAPYSLI